MPEDEHTGRFFVLEGTNASGKATQFTLLKNRLEEAGYDVATFDFPQYSEESSFFVREYLRGAYGSSNEVGPYTASLFYALDRYSVRDGISSALKSGKIVLANRFSGSNMAHQATYFSRPEERRDFYEWLDDLEHRMLKIPRPNRNFVLRVDEITATQLLAKRHKETGTELDIHEKEKSHLKRTITIYDELSILYTNTFVRIDCVRSGDMLEPDHIHELIWQAMQEDLPEPLSRKGTATRGTAAIETPQPTNDTKIVQQISLLDAVRMRLPIVHEGAAFALQSLKPELRDQNGNYSYFIPEGMSKEAKVAYTSTMNKLFGSYASLYQQLRKSLPEDETRAALQGIIPVSILVNVEAEKPISLPKPNLVFNQLVDTMLPSMHAKVDKPVKLVSYEPRNEFDLIPYMLYEQSNLSLTDLRNIVETWTYEEKEKIFMSYLGSQNNKPALNHADYLFDIVADLSLFFELSRSVPTTQYTFQELTPRFGYTVPQSVVDKDVADNYDECFRASINLYTFILEAGLRQTSQYTVLVGHKQRFSTLLNVSGINNLTNIEVERTNISFHLLSELKELAREKHPQTFG